MPHLSTKVYIPTVRPDIVKRTRLIARLNENLQRPGRLILISAPAGFGKTTLITDWITQLEQRVAWLSLDDNDNDAAGLLSYIIFALQQINKSIGQGVVELLNTPQTPPALHLLASLINSIAHVPDEMILVLDDYHLITDAAIHNLLETFLNQMPPNLRMVILTREDPPIALARLRVRGHLSEIRERDLRFMSQEVADFLSQTMGVDLIPAHVATLETRTEGWVAGLQLAALALQDEHIAPAAFIADFAGSDRYIVDYLVSEVLSQQPVEVQAFLKQTAILNRMNAELCDAVTLREDSRRILDRLDDANLFIVALDRRREWYRYHHLFAEFLCMSLSPEERVALHKHAVTWLLAHGLWADAIRHALLAAQITGVYDDAVEIIAQVGESFLFSSSLTTLGRWIKELPETVVAQHATLMIYAGWVALFTNDADRATYYVQLARETLGTTELRHSLDMTMLDLLTAYLALAIGDYEQVMDTSGRAMRNIPAEAYNWRALAYWIRAETLERAGRVTEAIELWDNLNLSWESLPNDFLRSLVAWFLAMALNASLRRSEAINLCQDVLTLSSDAAGQPTLTASVLLISLIQLYIEGHQLREARRLLNQALEMSDQLGLAELRHATYGTAAMLADAEGHPDVAFDAISHALQYEEQPLLADRNWILSVEADMHLRMGGLRFTEEWATGQHLAPDMPIEYLNIHAHLTYARLLVRQNQLGVARSYLDRLAAFLHEHHLGAWLISVRILQALTAERSRNHKHALDYLADAVELGASGGYVYRFLHEDPQALELLRPLRSLNPDFVDRVLNAARETAIKQEMRQPLADPLTDREMEVLALIEAGLSNAEIAERLVIAVGTVKRHINQIYGKLDANSRTQALVKARSLRLLSFVDPHDDSA